MSGLSIVTVRKMIYIVCFCLGAPRIGKDGRPLLNKPKVVLPIDHDYDDKNDYHEGYDDNGENYNNQ